MEKSNGDLISNKGIILNSIDEPSARFGHSVNFISKTSVLIFGGATEIDNIFTMTADIFTYNIISNTWQKIEHSNGPFPTARAAHATATVRENQILLFGGSIGNGRFASDDLWFLDLEPEKKSCSCLKVSIDGPSPGKRYGHSMIYLIPTLILFGGCRENEILNDFWILYTDKTPFKWVKLTPLGESPKPRVYHTANLFKYYHNEEMIVIFGGRDQQNNSLSDIIGIRKNLDQIWEWCYFYENYFQENNIDLDSNNQESGDNNINYGSSCLDNFANLKNKNTKNFEKTNKNLSGNESNKTNIFKNDFGISLKRQQHCCVFIGPFLFVVGGRTCSKEKARFDVFSMISLRWFNFGTLDFYRHSVWGFQNIKSVDEYDMYLYIYGGFQGETSKLNKDFIRIDVIELFSSIEILNNELDEYINNVINMEMEKNKKLSRNRSEPKNIFKLKDSVVMSKINEITDINNNIKNLSLSQLTEESKRIVEWKNKSYISKQKKMSNSLSVGNLNKISKISNDTFGSQKNLEIIKNAKQLIKIDEKLLKEFFDLMPLPENFKPLDLENNIKILKKENIVKLIQAVKDLLTPTSCLLNLQYPIKIFGSINGQYNDLINFFNTFGRPHEYKGDIDSFEYLFMGNLVNRGTFSLEVICLIFALKLKYPQSIHFLRGSNDDLEISKYFGLADECRYKLREDITKPDSVFQMLCDVFNYFPLAALIENKILCVHSGIGKNIKSLDEIASLQKPYNPYKNELILDLLWSSPVEYYQDYPSENFTKKLRNRTFDESMLNEFFEKNKISYMIRSHNILEAGFEKLYNEKVFSIFSSINYCEQSNLAGLIMINKSYKIQPKILTNDVNFSSWFKSGKVFAKYPPSPKIKKST